MGTETAYSRENVARICGVSQRRLRYWESTELVRTLPKSTAAAADRDGAGRSSGSANGSGHGSGTEKTNRNENGGRRDTEHGEAGFDFSALVGVKSIVALLAQGVSLRRIRRGIEELRAFLPQLDPATALRWQPMARRLVVRFDGVLMEPSGQLVLEFPSAREAQVARLVEHVPRPGSAAARRRALSDFERGCSLDTDPATWDEAVLAYRHAISCDPDFADAHCNLGSVYFNRGLRSEARQAFERAIELVPGHVEANLNLGTMLEELGQDQSALARYRAALATDPLYPDVHVSLGLLYEKLSLPRTAGSHWRRYLQLDPQGTWADIARRRLMPPA